MSVLASVVAIELGVTDCEELHEGFLAQPVNAITSLGYVAAGVTLLVRGIRKGRPNGDSDAIYGSTLMAIGIGSVAFHGPQPRGSEFVHDVPIAAALLYIFLYDLGRLGRLKRVNRAFGFGLIPILGAFAIAPGLAPYVAGALAAAAVAAEIAYYRQERSGPEARWLRRREATVVVLLIGGAAGYMLGRTGSAFCSPSSLFQLHGLWHLLSAAAFALWGFTAFRSEEVNRRSQIGSRP